MSVAMVTPIGVPSSQKDQALHVYACGNGGHHFPSLREMKKKILYSWSEASHATNASSVVYKAINVCTVTVDEVSILKCALQSSKKQFLDQ